MAVELATARMILSRLMGSSGFFRRLIFIRVSCLYRDEGLSFSIIEDFSVAIQVHLSLGTSVVRQAITATCLQVISGIRDWIPGRQVDPVIHAT